jgi:hypothetical protein
MSFVVTMHLAEGLCFNALLPMSVDNHLIYIVDDGGGDDRLMVSPSHQPSGRHWIWRHDMLAGKHKQASCMLALQCYQRFTIYQLQTHCSVTYISPSNVQTVVRTNSRWRPVLPLHRRATNMRVVTTQTGTTRWLFDAVLFMNLFPSVESLFLVRFQVQRRV